MRHSLRRVAGAVAMATALAAPNAHADDITDTADDTVATVVDSALDLARGCTPVVTSWTPIPLTYTPYIPPGSTSTWYREIAGGKANLSCSAPVKIVARLADVSTPPFLPYRGGVVPTYVTSKTPQDLGSVNVPYFGPDAPVLRPFGKITVHVEVFRKLSTGRYAQIRSGCMEWEYLLQPGVGVTLTYPAESGVCTYDATFVALDALEPVAD